MLSFLISVTSSKPYLTSKHVCFNSEKLQHNEVNVIESIIETVYTVFFVQWAMYEKL